jgi:hypothetical protein
MAFFAHHRKVVGFVLSPLSLCSLNNDKAILVIYISTHQLNYTVPEIRKDRKHKFLG